MTTVTEHPDTRVDLPAQPGPSPASNHRTPASRYGRQAGRRRLAGDALTVALWLSFAVAIALWLADGGAADFGSVGQTLKSLGIVSGLIATNAMVVMLFLAARIPLVDRAIGHDHALALHSRMGQWTFAGLLAHAGFLLLGYAELDGVNIIAEFGTLWGTADFVLAVLGLALLAAVAVSSIVAVRHRLAHEVWHVIHLVSYAAVAVSLPHQFSMSGLFADGLPRAYWIALFVAAGLSLLTWRVFLPLFASLEHRFRVTAVERIAPDVVNIEVTGHRVADLDVAAGQFFHWRFLAPGLWWHQHPFSISAAPAGERLRITVRALGDGTRQLMAVRPGTPVLVEGPYGVFSDRARTSDDVVLVGIGVGIGPVRAVLEGTHFEPGHATVILRGGTLQEVFLLDEFEALCRTKGARLLVLPGHRGHYADGSDTWLPAEHAHRRLIELAPALLSSDLYVCGPQAAADLVIADAKAAGLPEEQIHNERFTW